MFNLLKTAVLMAAITALFMVIGNFVGGRQGMMLALLVAVGMNFFSYWFSDKMVLRMYNAHEVDEHSAPQFYRTIRELAQQAGLPMPRVFLIDEDAPNAFATGRDPEHAAVAATTGILRVLTDRELRGVMAHELAHVRHRDILISTVSATMAEPRMCPASTKRSWIVSLRARSFSYGTTMHWSTVTEASERVYSGGAVERVCRPTTPATTASSS